MDAVDVRQVARGMAHFGLGLAMDQEPDSAADDMLDFPDLSNDIRLWDYITVRR